MILKEKLEKEQPGNTDIYLYREGLFWKAYEYSAFLFIRHIRAYQAQKRAVKSLKRDVVSLGFPDSVVEEILAGKSHDKTDEKCIRITGIPATEEEAFEQWKAETPVITETQANRENRENNPVLSRLKAFRVESSTPMQCMSFISELQKELLQ